VKKVIVHVQRYGEIVQNPPGCCEKKVDDFWPQDEQHWSDSSKIAQPKT